MRRILCMAVFVLAQAGLAPDIFGDTFGGAAVAEETSVTSEETSLRTRVLFSAYAITIAGYGYKAWWGSRTPDFQVVHEGWFGQDTYRGGADKLGHGYFTYASTRLLTRGLEWAGHNRQQSITLSAMTVVATTLAIEILDGYTKDIGFSYQDLVMDTAGIGLGMLLESNPRLDALFDFRLHYWPSSAARRLGEHDPVEDYSGQTYLFITKASAIPVLQENKVLRYLEFAIGYGSRGYKPGDATQVRSRNVYYGISLNLAQLLDDTVFHEKNNATYKSAGTQRVTHNILELIQVPGTVALVAEKL